MATSQELSLTQNNAAHDLAVSVGKGTLFGVFANIAQVGTRFIMVPVVIAHLGLDGYGIWNIIMTTGAYMRFGSAGLKSAFQKYVAEAIGDGDYARANRLITTGSAGVLVLSLIGLLPVVFFARPLASQVGVPQHFLTSTAGSFSLLAVIMILSNFAAVYEATVMGANRIDLVKKFNVAQMLLEATAIIVLLSMGYGLLAMTAVMAASEVFLVSCCFIASSKVLPQVRVHLRYFSKDVAGELVRFAGSYQLLNILEIVYAALSPLVVLKVFGAETAGIYAVCTRLSTAAVLFQESSLLPLLSGGTTVFVWGMREHLRQLVSKAFKWTLVLALPPLTFISVFGGSIVKIWTGETDPLFQTATVLVCAGAAFKAVGRAGFILYRATGGAWMDILRQLICMAVILLLGAMGRELGFTGVLTGIIFGELLGMLFMLYALKRAVDVLDFKVLLRDAYRLLIVCGFALALGRLVAVFAEHWIGSTRLNEVFLLMIAVIVSGIAAHAALRVVKLLTADEQKAIWDVVVRRRKNGLAGAQA